jgi:hypothetical protein
MDIHIVGSAKPVLGKNSYTLSGIVSEQHWELYEKGKLILDLGNDGGVTFSQASKGIAYTIQSKFIDEKGLKGTAKLNITPVPGKPSIQNLKWQDEYYNDLGKKVVAYSDNVRLYIHTLNIPVGHTLDVTIWEDEGLDGHSDSSRNMGTYKTTAIDKYGKTELFLNNMKVFMKILNNKDYVDDDIHQFYVEVKYQGKMDVIKDTIKLYVHNFLHKMVEIPKTKSVVKIFVPDKEKKPENKKGVKVYVNVFFDGTKNNADNTKSRLASDKKKKGLALNSEEIEGANIFEKYDDDDSSYDNYYSNIAIMHQTNISKSEDKRIKVYIEGEGTRDKKGDDTKGYAFGSGDKSGIPAKVSKAFTSINEQIQGLIKKKIIDKTEFVNEIEMTVFGFSRGAAAARNFIALKHKIQDKYNLETSKFHVKFVGLFDTVSSYNDGISASPDFDNDIEELQLKMEGVQKVIHLTAADEYREYFSLTTIKNSIEQGIGFELQLPGAHSDIGGGYAEKENEIRHFDDEPDFKNMMETVLDQGWYKRKQIKTILEAKIGERPNATRTGIPNSYQYIPLAIMIAFAEKHGLAFDKSLFEKGKKESYIVPDDLSEAKNSLLSYALEKEGAHSLKVTLHEDYLKPIRNKYLHRSTSNATGKTGRYKDGKPYRKIHQG